MTNATAYSLVIVSIILFSLQFGYQGDLLRNQERNEVE